MKRILQLSAFISLILIGWSVRLNAQEKGEPVGEIHEIVVSQKARERGVGKLLMEKAIGLFKEKGLSKAGLWVGRTNTHAYDFYRHLGFRETGRVGIWIRMEKAL